MSTLIAVAFGGALGAVARYGATEWIRGLAGDAFPWGTIAVNVVGSFALGFLLVVLQSMAPSNQVRAFLAVGLLGSFTTFSTFSYEAVELMRVGAVWRAGGYAAGSLAVGIAAVLLGGALGTVVTRPLGG